MVFISQSIYSSLQSLSKMLIGNTSLGNANFVTCFDFVLTNAIYNTSSFAHTVLSKVQLEITECVLGKFSCFLLSSDFFQK